MADMTPGRGARPLAPPPRELAALWRDLGIPAGYAANRGLPLHPETQAHALRVVAVTAAGREIRLAAPAADAWSAMSAAASAERIALIPLSGFRGVARQAELIRAKRDAGQSIVDILQILAAPGCSEHHTGRAVDVGTPGLPPLEERFADTAAFAWLSQRARAFGFSLSYPRDNPHGLVFEPWHWCWTESPKAAGPAPPAVKAIPTP
jgi:D-alanyl-D-alanine carboxypeptidase